MIQAWLVKKAKALKASQSYQEKKRFFRDLLKDRETSYTKYFDSFMIVLILFSVLLLVLNKTYSIPAWILFVDLYVVSAIFIVEYLLRFWIYSDSHKIILEEAKQKSSLLQCCGLLKSVSCSTFFH